VGFLARIARLRNQLEARNVDLFKDVNAAVDINLGGRRMPKKKLTKDELDKQRGEELPEREVMSTLNPPIQPLPPVGGEDYLFPYDPVGGGGGETTGGTS
jgi:hypothetical protein